MSWRTNLLEEGDDEEEDHSVGQSSIREAGTTPTLTSIVENEMEIRVE
jgi:hypothetical protein